MYAIHYHAAINVFEFVSCNFTFGNGATPPVMFPANVQLVFHTFGRGGAWNLDGFVHDCGDDVPLPDCGSIL